MEHQNITYNGETSEQLLAEKVQNQVLATNPDVVLYEAPLLMITKTLKQQPHGLVMSNL